MPKLSLVVIGVLVAVLAITSVLYAQGTRGQRGQMTEAQWAQMREQMIERMLQQTGLTETEKAAARKTTQAKDQARQALTAEFAKLRRTANQANATNEELQNAPTAYWAALGRYYQKVQAADQALMNQLSIRSQVQCLSLGILENGLGRMGMGRGMRQPAGARQGRPGQQRQSCPRAKAIAV